MVKETCEYRARATLGNITLPEEYTEIAFSDFSIKECPNRATPIPLKDENGTVIDVDWEYPERPDHRFPVCDYYFETCFTTQRSKGWPEAEWKLDWGLTRLRLYSTGRLWGSLYRVDDLARPGMRVGVEEISDSIRRRPKEPPFPPSFRGIIVSTAHLYKIDQGKLQPLQDFVNKLGKAPGKAFEIAVRRFHQSFDRDLPEDQALDLFIALESLLSDDPEAIRYKIALRAAYLIGLDRTDRTNIYDFLKAAYNKRNEIVHGRKTAIAWLRERSYSDHANIAQLEDVVKRILFTLLDKACGGTVLGAGDLDRALFFSDYP